MDLPGSYFAIADPLNWLDRWFNPYKHSTHVMFRNKPLQVKWTRRAQRALQQRQHPLIAELQLYFSCVVKKRVLFHEQHGSEMTVISPMLNITFSTVQSEACSPEEFASNFPVKREMDSHAASKMHPTCFWLDYIDKQWQGQFDLS